MKLPTVKIGREQTGMAKDGTVSFATLGGLYLLWELDKHLEEMVVALNENTEAAQQLLKFITQ